MCAETRMVGYSGRLAGNRRTSNRQGIKTDVVRFRGCGWPATLSLLSPRFPVNSTTQAVRDFYDYYHGNNDSMFGLAFVDMAAVCYD